MVDVNTPLTNPEFVTALELLQKEPIEAHEKNFIHLLREAHFLLLLKNAPEHDKANADGIITSRKRAELAIEMHSNPQGQPLNMAFTDWTALRAWRDLPDQATLIVSFNGVSTLVLKDGSKLQALS